MKHSLIFLVLLGVTILLPAPSKECGTVATSQELIRTGKESLQVVTPEGAMLLSPVKGLLFQLP